MVFLGLNVSKFKNFLTGYDLKRYEDEKVHPCLREVNKDVFLGIYIRHPVSLEECTLYSRQIQSWLRKHCLSGVAYHGDHSKGYELIFVPKEEENEVTDWICE